MRVELEADIRPVAGTFINASPHAATTCQPVFFKNKNFLAGILSAGSDFDYYLLVL